MSEPNRRAIALAGSLALGLLLVGCGGGGSAKQETAGPAATQASNAPLIITDSVVRGHANVAKEDSQAKVCVANSRYLHNEMVVWRIKVIDPATGNEMNDSAVRSVQVGLPSGQTFDAKYGDHPSKEPTDRFWTTSWVIPPDYPSGTVAYTIAATGSDGRSGKYVPFNVGISLLTVVPDAVPIIPAG